RRKVKSSLYLLPITTTSLKHSKKLGPIAKKKLSIKLYNHTFTTIPDITRFISKEVLNSILTYYKVTLKCFINNITTKVNLRKAKVDKNN
ncbi:Male sterility NAD-binding, partial [Penicillium coprophilum]|uniref:Male sterility NAD-binding n=1 Tax=Penicillium coprophilum TaxID=36646 RepID=UPI002384D520